PAVPKVRGVEGGLEPRGRVGAGDGTVMEKGRSLIRSADIGGIVRVGIDVLEDGPDDALRADAVIMNDVRGEEGLPGRGHAAAGEDAIGAGMERVERAVIGAGVEVTRGAGDAAIT